jgi:hypothetical protein
MRRQYVPFTTVLIVQYAFIRPAYPQLPEDVFHVHQAGWYATSIGIHVRPYVCGLRQTRVYVRGFLIFHGYGISGVLTFYQKSGKLGKVSEKTRWTEFRRISGNFFRGFPGIPEIRGNFSGNSGVFPRTRAAEQGAR